LLVSNVAEEASLAALAERITAEGIHALAFIPLLYQARLMGKFMIYHDQPHEFTVEEVQLAQTIAGHVAFAIERQRTTLALQEANDRLEQHVAARTAELHQRNAALQAEIARREDAEKALHQESHFLRLMQVIAAAANEARTVEEAFQFALNQICDYTGWPVGHVYFWEAAQSHLVPSAIWHISDGSRFETFRQVTTATRMRPGVGLPGRVYRSGKPAWIPDVLRDDNFTRTQAAADLAVRAGFAFPVLVGSQVAAVLEFFSADVARSLVES
jgi:GAF domain-containing protein